MKYPLCLSVDSGFVENVYRFMFHPREWKTGTVKYFADKSYYESIGSSFDFDILEYFIKKHLNDHA